MRVLVAGATGIIGMRIVRLLARAGHDVAGTTRSASKASLLGELGVQAVVCDVFGGDLEEHLTAFRPDVVVHQLTDLPDDASQVRARADANNRMRREGTRRLLAAATAAGARGLVAQSVAWELPPDGARAAADLERQVLDHGGTVVRYGRFHGPGTYFPTSLPPPPRIHVDDAAARTIPIVEDARRGVVVVVDEGPIPPGGLGGRL